MKYLQQQQKKRRLEERRVRELRRLAQRIARKEKEDPRDVIYDLTGEWEPVKTHEWDEF
jgi:hypothetical protein